MSRYSMYKQISESLPEGLKGHILGISGIDNLRNLIDPSAKITEVHYPETDIQALPFADSTFDVVISDQVLEHVEKPWMAVSESFRVLRPGGLVIHTTCFQKTIHGDWEGWGDYFRFTPEGLKSLCPKGTEFIACTGWGNRLACFLNSFNLNWKVKRWGIGRWLANYNEWRSPLATWVIARKVVES